MSLTIRKGTPGDLDALEQLYGEVCDHLAANINYTGWKRDIYPVRQDAEAGLQELKAAGRIEYDKAIEMGGTTEDEVKWEGMLEEVSASGEYDLIIVGTYQMPEYLKKS